MNIQHARPKRLLKYLGAACFLVSGASQLAVGQAVSANPPAGQVAAMLNQYCLTCHNEKLKTGGIVLSTADLNNIPGRA